MSAEAGCIYVYEALANKFFEAVHTYVSFTTYHVVSIPQEPDPPLVSVTQSSQMTLPYAMLLTRLFKHVQTNHPYPLSDELYLVDHVMIPLSSKRIYRFKNKGKRPRLPTPTPSNSSGSSQSPPNPGTSTNPSGDPIENYTLDPMVYLN
ncbi:hypothetical protein Tco_0178442 [Tanacetum coccineum]